MHTIDIDSNLHATFCCLPTHSLTLSLSHSPTHPLTHCPTHSLSLRNYLSNNHPVTHQSSHQLKLPPTYPLIHLDPFTHPFTHPPIHVSNSHALLLHSLIHSLTHPLTPELDECSLPSASQAAAKCVNADCVNQPQGYRLEPFLS